LIGIISAVLLYEDFEDATFPPTGWDSTYTNYYLRWQRRTSGVVFGTASAGVATAQGYDDTGESELYTPPIPFASLDSLIFFYEFPGTLVAFASTSDTVYLQYSLDDGATWNTLWYIDSTSVIAVDTTIKVALYLGDIAGPDTIIFRWRFVDYTTATIAYNRYFNIDSITVLGTALGNLPPTVALVGTVPTCPDTADSAYVVFTASDPDGSVASATLKYSYDGTTFDDAITVNLAADTFVAAVPPRGAYGKVYYYAVAYDDAGDSTVSDLGYYIAGFKKIYEVRGLTLGDSVQVKAQVTRAFGSAVYVQDSTEPVGGVSSGMVVYSSDFSAAVDTGYLACIRGITTEYRSLFEVSPVHAFEVIDSSSVYPPVYITVADMNETYEGMLVAVRGFTWSTYPGTFAASTNYDISDSTGTGVLRISSSSTTDIDGEPAPDGVLEVWAVLGQYYSTYQLLPRYINDFSPYVEAITITPDTPVINSPATVTARVYDPDGLSDVFLHYSADTTAGYITVPADSITADSTAYFTIDSVPAGDTLYLKVEASDSRGRITYSFIQAYPTTVNVASSERPSVETYVDVLPVPGGILLRWSVPAPKVIKVYSASGRLYSVVRLNGTGSRRVSLPRGVYFLRNGKEIGRIVVR